MAGNASELDLPLASDRNVAEYTVGEVSRAVKRTLEGTFDHIRVRGEVSRPNYHGSGHLYFTLKDDEAVIDSVCWRGTVGRLGLRLEEGMEVIVTGRVSSYPRSSKYQIVVEAVELAGEGALLKLLEDRRKKLAAEGLFDAERKKKIPFLPEVIGVVTSPTGAVIRDILHRLNDRFPRRVILWPCPVQGEGAAEKVAAAIAGFNRFAPDGPIPRPDVLIVARGGGSLEDLWAFNEEVVVRAAAASGIPLISAVGHETDTTLIDFAADLRAPTPTAAAEMAVPVRAEILAQILDCARRMVAGLERYWDGRRVRLDGLARGLPRPEQLLGDAQQDLDRATDGLANCMQRRLQITGERVDALGNRLRHPRDVMKAAGHRLEQCGERLDVAWAAYERHVMGRFDRLDAGPRIAACVERLLQRAGDRLTGAGQLLESYSYRNVLERGFVLVRDSDGQPVKRAADATAGALVELEFFDGKRGAAMEGESVKPIPKPARRKPSDEGDDGQGSLL